MQVSVQMTTVPAVLLWLSAAVTLSEQEMVQLNVTNLPFATCGQSVTLNCGVSPSQDSLAIKHMTWTLVKRHLQLCNVEDTGQTTAHINSTPSVFECSYTHGQLALTFQQVQPIDEGEYMCKLRSNKGIVQQNTLVKLRECYRNVSVELTGEGPTCTFTGVHPEGEVHWFHGPTAVPASSLKTMEHVEDGGWLTIKSTLIQSPHLQKDWTYNCSLQMPRSGRYLATAQTKDSSLDRTPSIRSSTGACVPLGTFVGLIFSTVFLVEL